MSKRKNELKNEKKQKTSKRYKFFLGSRQRYILISSDFDSGNIQLVRQISQFQYRLASVYDGTNTDHRVNSKGWFYFCVTGFPKNTKGRFFVTKVQTLSSIYNSKYSKCYRPVYKSGDNGKWQRLQGDVQLVMRQDQLECVFEYLFKDQSQKVYFAFSYPFTFTEHKMYIDSLNQYILNDQFYFYKQILVKSLQGREIHLLTITSHDHKDVEKETQQIFNEKIFPQQARPLRFAKPVVLISARVHPSETASSYAMKGLINFLTNKTDLRAKLLRKMFIFMIIPMINVDGVYHGHFRMDTQGKNLNRYYIKPSFQKHPAIYAIKQLANYLNSQNRLSFYFDLHAHNAKKGHFIYGNSINDFVEQVQSQVFCKLIAMNNKGFQYKYCNFTQKHMKAKDKNEDLTKQGCGRVVMHKLAKIIHSYSVQCGIISPNTINWLPNPPNTDFKLQSIGFQQDKLQSNSNKIYKTNDDDNALFTCEMYENLGKNLMVSILDVFDKNPYNRVYKSTYKTMDLLRRVTAFQIFHEDQRFRMFERFVFGKVKNINDLIKQVLNQKLHYKKLYSFYFFEDKQLKDIAWPQNIPGLCRLKPSSPKKLMRYRSKSLQTNQYSQSFRKTLLGFEQIKPFITQQQLQQDEQMNSQNSSQTQNFDNQQNNLAEINKLLQSQSQSQKNTLKIIDQINQKRQSFQQQMNRESSKNQIKLMKQTQQTQVTQITKRKLQIFPQESSKFFIKNSRKSYLRMIKPRFSPQKIQQQQYLSQKLQEKDWLETTRNQIRENLNEQIRNELKKRFKKQFIINKKKGILIQFESKFKSNLKSNYPVTIRQRIKSETSQKTEKRQRLSERMSKLQLPLLTSQLMVAPIISSYLRQGK